MLASPAESVADALEAFGEAAFELKLDGARIQVHKSGDEVRVFSRALRDVTAAVPEVVEAVRLVGRHAISFSTEKCSRCSPTERRCRFKKRCAGLGDAWMSIAFDRSCR